MTSQEKAPDRLDGYDLIVFSITVLIPLGIGIYSACSGGRQKTTNEFLLGGRLINYIPVAISLCVTFESSIMMLGLPAEGYQFGTQICISVVSNFFIYIAIAYTVVPLIHPLKITSAYEYLEMRFQSKAVRLLGTFLGTIHLICYMGLVLFGPAIAMEAVTGFPVWISIISVSVVSVIYTSIGGIKAVVWTDVFQAVIMFSGMFAVLIKGTIDVGSPGEVWHTAIQGKRLELFNFDPSPFTRHTFWSLMIGAGFRNMGMAFNQGTIQRISSTQTQKEAKRMIFIVSPMLVISTLICVYEGVIAYSYYETKGCDPLASNQIANANQILPYFVMDIFKGMPGMPGLFIASLFSGSLSTLSTALSSLSAMVWTDLVHPYFGDVSDFTGTIIAKFTVVLFGAIAAGLAFLVTFIGGTLHQISFIVLGSVASISSGLFLLGCFCHRATAKGALVGGLVGITISAWISIGKNFSPSVHPSVILAPASIDQCQAHDHNFNRTSSSLYHPIYGNQTTGLEQFGFENNTVPLSSSSGTSDPIEGIAIVYNISYQWIPLIGVCCTVLVGYLFSLLTGPNKPGDVDPRYLLPVSKSVFYFLPSTFQDWLSSLGTQFMKEEYKARFLQAETRERKENSDPIWKHEDGDVMGLNPESMSSQVGGWHRVFNQDNGRAKTYSTIHQAV